MDITSNSIYLGKNDLVEAITHTLTQSKDTSIIYKKQTGCGFTTCFLQHIKPNLFTGYEKTKFIFLVPTNALYAEKLPLFENFADDTVFFVTPERLKNKEDSRLQYSLKNEKCVLFIDEIDGFLLGQTYRNYYFEGFFSNQKDFGIQKIIGITASLPRKLQKNADVKIISKKVKNVREYQFFNSHHRKYFFAMIKDFAKNGFKNGENLALFCIGTSDVLTALYYIKKEGLTAKVICGDNVREQLTRANNEIFKTINNQNNRIIISTNAGERGVDFIHGNWTIAVNCTNMPRKICYTQQQRKQISGRPRAKHVNGTYIPSNVKIIYFFGKYEKETLPDKTVINQAFLKKYLTNENKELKGFLCNVKDEQGFKSLAKSTIFYKYKSAEINEKQKKYKEFVPQFAQITTLQRISRLILHDNEFRSYKKDVFSPYTDSKRVSRSDHFFRTKSKNLLLAFATMKNQNLVKIEKGHNNIYTLKPTESLKKLQENTLEKIKEKLSNHKTKSKKELKKLNVYENYKETVIIEAKKDIKKQKEHANEYLLCCCGVGSAKVTFYRDYNVKTFFGGDVEQKINFLLQKSGLNVFYKDITAQAPTAVADYVKEIRPEAHENILKCVKERKIYLEGKSRKRSKLDTNRAINQAGPIRMTEKYITDYMKRIIFVFKDMLKKELKGRTAHELTTKKEAESIREIRKFIQNINVGKNIAFSRLHDSISAISFEVFKKDVPVMGDDSVAYGHIKDEKLIPPFDLTNHPLTPDEIKEKKYIIKHVLEKYSKTHNVEYGTFKIYFKFKKLNRKKMIVKAYDTFLLLTRKKFLRVKKRMRNRKHSQSLERLYTSKLIRKPSKNYQKKAKERKIYNLRKEKLKSAICANILRKKNANDEKIMTKL